MSGTNPGGAGDTTAHSSSLSAVVSSGTARSSAASSGLSATVSYGVAGSTANSSSLSATVSLGTANSTAHSSSLSAVVSASTKSGERLNVTVTVVSSSIPNNTQTGGAITGAASGTLILEDITINTGTTGIVAPTNIEFSTDNVAGKTGAGAPIFLEAVAGLGANITASKKDASSHFLPILLESGKKIFIHGDDAAGTGAGIATITMMFQVVSAGATISGVNLP